MKSGRIFLQFLLCAFLIIATMTIFTDGKLYFDDAVIPKHYEITSIPYIEGFLQGQLTVTIYISKEIDCLHVRSDKLDIIESNIHNSTLFYKSTILHINKTSDLVYNSSFSSGLYELYLIFITQISTNNNTTDIFRPFGINKENNVVTQLYNRNISKIIEVLGLLPKWGEPRISAFLTFSYKYRHYMAPSESLRMQYGIKSGTIWTYNNNSLILVAMIVSDLVRLSSTSQCTNINIWCRRVAEKSMHFALETIKNITIFLENNLHSHLCVHLRKIDAVNHVAIPDFLKENSSYYIWGLIPHRDNNIIYEEESNNFMRKIQVTHSIMDTIVDNTFGKTSSWMDIGLKTFLGIWNIDKMPNSFQMMNMFVVENQHESFYLSHPEEIIQYSYNIINIYCLYCKGPFLLRMLQHLITEDVFLKGVEKYLQKHAPTFPLPPNNYLWSSIQAAINESDNINISDINVEKIMNAWMEQESYPILNITQNDGNMNISIKNLNNNNILDIPLTYTTQEHLNFNDTFLVTWIQNREDKYDNYSSIKISTKYKDGWIIANLQQAGYYRVIYDDNNWLKIARYLDSEEYTKIHVLNRAQIIDDAFYFMLIRELNSSIFWNITSYLSRETSYIAWYPMIKALEYMSSIFSLSDERVEKIKMRILSTLEGILEKIGYYNKFEHEHTALLRQEAARWACFLNSSVCKKAAVDILQKNVIDPQEYKIMPWWEEWTYCNGFRTANATIRMAVFENYMKMNKTNSNFLLYINDLSTIRNYAMLINERFSKILVDNNTLNLYFLAIAKCKNNLLLNNILTKLEIFEGLKKVNRVVLLTYIINHVHSKEQFDEISDFVKNNDETLLPYVKRKIMKRLSEVSTQMTFLQQLTDY